MPKTLEGKLVVAISSRALFDFEEENRLFDKSDDKEYMEFQLSRLEEPAHTGVAFPLVKKLLCFNTQEMDRVEVVVLSRNDPVSGLRVFRSAQAAHLPLEKGVFTRGREPFRYLRPLQATLFLSANAEDVRSALAANFAAALVYPESLVTADRHPDEIRIAFDGDAGPFGDEAERIYQDGGLAAFQAHETEKVAIPLPSGPFKPLLEALQNLQSKSPEAPMRLRTALVTARSAPAHERAIRTLMAWKIQVDEAMFLGGLDKADFLREFEPDFFFDDQTGYCESAARVGPTGQVISGVRNEI